MEQTRVISVGKQLKGMPILASDTGVKLGEASDAIVRPETGKVLGITLRNPAREFRALPRSSFVIGADAIMVNAGAKLLALEYSGELSGGVPAQGKLAGASVVTESGKVIGNVSDIYISAEIAEFYYHVSESGFQRLMGHGFYLAGNAPTAVSPDSARLIVPTNTDEHRASSIRDLLQPAGADYPASER